MKRTAQIGLASFFNQIAMMIVQVVLNNSLTHYGAQSVYGEAIPLACAGIVIKVNQVFFSVVIGLAQGSQPVESFNYGAEKYDRVRKAYRLAATAGVIISVISFALFQIFPGQILSSLEQESRNILNSAFAFSGFICSLSGWTPCSLLHPLSLLPSASRQKVSSCL